MILKLNLGNAGYHSVKNLLSSRLLHKNIKIRIYKNLIFAVVPYRRETWKEHRLRAFKNKVLTRIFGPKRDEVTGGWRKLHNEELHNLYSSPGIIRMITLRRIRWAGHVARIGTKKNA
jgi:hypothetical protein